MRNTQGTYRPCENKTVSLAPCRDVFAQLAAKDTADRYTWTWAYIWVYMAVHGVCGTLAPACELGIHIYVGICACLGGCSCSAECKDTLGDFIKTCLFETMPAKAQGKMMSVASGHCTGLRLVD